MHSAIATRREVQAANVEFHLACNNLGNLVGKARHISTRNGYRCAESTIGIVAPAGLHNAVGVVLLKACCVGAVRAVNSNTRRDSYKAEDVVALDGVTALGEFILDVVNLLVNDQRIGAVRYGGTLGRLTLLLLALGLGSRHAALLLRLARNPLVENLLDRDEVNLLQGNHRIHLASRAHLEHLAKICHSLVDGDIYLPILQLALQLLAAHTGVLHLLLAQERLNAATRL